MISIKKFLATGMQRSVALAMLAAMALLWSAVAWNHQDSERRALDEIRRETASLALLFAHDVDSTFRSVDHALLALRRTWVSNPANMSDMVKEQTDYLDGAVVQVSVAGADGNLIYSSLGMPKEPPFVGEREYFKVLRAGLQDKLFVSRPLIGEVSGKWSIQLTRPIFRHAEFAGVVVISVDPNYFVRFYQDAGMGKDGSARMIRDTGEVMARSSEQDQFVGKVIVPSPYAKPGAPQQGSFRRKAQTDGVERLSSYYRLPQYGLTVVVGPSLAERLAPLRTQQRQIVLAAGLVSLTILLLAWLMTRALERKEAKHLELVKAEAATRDSSQRLNEVIWGTNTGTWEWNVQTGGTLFNQRWAEIVGYTLAELAPISIETWHKLAHPDDAKLSAALLTRCFNRELETYTCEARMRHKGGHWVWVGIRGRVVEWAADGKPLRMAGTHQDISESKQAQVELAESYWFTKATIDAASAHICVVDSTGKILTVNQAWRDFYDANQSPALAADYGVGANYLQICRTATGPGSAEADTVAKGLLQVIRGECDEFRIEYPCHSPTEHRWFQLHVTRFQGDSGNVVLSHENVTEQKAAQAELQLAASVFTHAREGIMITDVAGTIMDANDSFFHITGYSRDEVIGQNPRILNSGSQPAEFYTTMRHTLVAQGYWSGEAWNRRKNGEIFAAMQTVSAVRDEAGNTQHYVSLFSDITAIKEHQKQLEHIAHYDTLTNLPNRLLLSDRMSQAMVQCQRHGKSIAVMFLDLDNLKAINDTYGHEVGDMVLVKVSQRMKEALRDGDTLARVGGDEFVAVLGDLDDPDDSNRVIERLMSLADTEIMISMPDGNAGQQKALKVSTSIGVTFYPQDDVDAEVLIRHADHAMYLAKQAGKNRHHFFDTAQDAAIRTKNEGIQQIKVGLKQQEFVLFYQPKLNMRTGEVVGAEALIRWQNPKQGLLPPGAFLHLVEDHPVSIQIGEWVIETALAQMSTWHAQGLALQVSVNIGALQLQQKDFPQRLHGLLQKHPDVMPHFLQLEVLETSAMQDIDKVTAVMRACQALGVIFALDDFGTGYSSLTYLKRLPAEVLKIDQSFIRHMTDDPDDLAIVKGVIELAHIFGRQVIAEGVETRLHGNLLLGIGCELAQGYGIARPMPAKDLPAWVFNWQAGATWTA